VSFLGGELMVYSTTPYSSPSGSTPKARNWAAKRSACCFSWSARCLSRSSRWNACSVGVGSHCPQRSYHRNHCRSTPWRRPRSYRLGI